jgi:hypothetical protein
LDALINFETAGTYDPLIENPLPDSTAVGLIQINDPTAQDLFGMSANELVSKYPTFDEQMDNVVLPYLQQRKRVYNDDAPLFTKHELYMAVFYPAYIKRDSDTLFSERIQQANTYRTASGTVTIKSPAEYAAFVDRRIREDTLLVPKLLPVILIGTGIIGVATWYLFRKRQSKRSRKR